MRENIEDPKEVFTALSDESAAAMPIFVIVNMDNADVRAKRISCSAVEFSVTRNFVCALGLLKLSADNWVIVSEVGYSKLVVNRL